MQRLFEKASRAFNIGANEGRRIDNGTIDVGFSRKVDYRIEAIFLENFSHLSEVRNVATHKAVSRIGGDFVEVAQISGVGEQVVIHDFDIFACPENVANETG